MPLDKPRLTQSIKTNIENEMTTLGFPTLNNQQLEVFSKAIAEAVVDEITANAVVNTSTTTPGAQSGSSTLPGTGTGTVS
jgi:hypothetical protein